MNFDNILQFMIEKHGTQKRKQGHFYFHHPLQVASILREKGFDERYQIVALLHDLLEDTDTTYDDIVKLTNKDIALAVLTLSKQQDYVMTEYIDNIKNNNLARMVKLADRFHNLIESIPSDPRFRAKYVLETEQYYYDLAKGTVFYEDMINITKVIKDFDNNRM